MTDWTTVPIATPQPTPIADGLRQHLDEVLAQIPSGRSVIVSGAVTTSGVEASLGAARRWRGADVSVSGWAGKAWGASGWSAGVRGSIVR